MSFSSYSESPSFPLLFADLDNMPVGTFNKNKRSCREKNTHSFTSRDCCYY